MSTGNNIERLTYRNSKEATRLAWNTVLLSIFFGSAVFIIVPLTTVKPVKTDKKLVMTQAPDHVKIDLPEKEKIYEQKNSVTKTPEKQIEPPVPPSAPAPPSAPIQINLSQATTEISFETDLNIKPEVDFKIEKIQAVRQVVDKSPEVQKAAPVNTPPAKNYNAVFSKNDVDSNAQIIKRVNPVYPRRALRRNIAGSVIISCIISKEGRITNPQITRSTPEGFFEDSCLEILDQMLYKPAVLDGKNVAQKMELTFDFGIQK